MEKIITKYDPPPIPDRRFDWRAYRENDLANSEGHHCGYGPSREEALADLARLDDERREADESLGEDV